MTRWPVQTLLDQPDITTRMVCRALRASGARWHRMLDEGLDDYQADRAAIRLGFMPWDIWGDRWFETGLAVTEPAA